MADLLDPMAPGQFLITPPLPAPPADLRQHWMLQARQWATLSPDPILRSGIVAVREERPVLASADRFPGSVRDTMARRRHLPTRQGSLLSAPAALVAQAAAHGLSLRGSTCYLWPLLDSAHSAALLIQAGVSGLVTLDLPCPSRLLDEMALVRQMAAETGLLLEAVDPPTFFDPCAETTPFHSVETVET